MKVTNQYKEEIFWRIFNADDTSYIFGIEDGFLKPGESKILTTPERLKIEFKRGSVIGPFIIRPWGKTYSIKDDIVLTKDGSIEILKVKIKSNIELEETYYGTDVTFVDLSNADNTPVSSVAEFSVSSASTEKLEQSITNGSEFTWSLTSEIAGSGEKEAIGISQKISRAMNQKFGSSETSTQETSIKYSYTAQGGKITAILCHWYALYETGVVQYGGYSEKYRALRSFKHDIDIEEKAKADDLPNELKAIWDKRQAKRNNRNS